jgi:hypothetical protein
MTAREVLAIEQRRRALAAIATCAWVLAAQLLGFGDGAMFFLPALLLFGLLALDRYPGERTLLRRLRTLRRSDPRPRRLGARGERPRAARPRGGALLAFSLAGRAPPIRS